MKRARDPYIEKLLGAERARKGPSSARRARVRERVNASILLSLAPRAPHAHDAPPAASPPAAPAPAPLPPVHPVAIGHAVAAAFGTLGPVARGIVVAVSIATAGVGLGVITRPQAPVTETRTIDEPRAVLAPRKPGGASGGPGDLRVGAPESAPPSPAPLAALAPTGSCAATPGAALPALAHPATSAGAPSHAAAERARSDESSPPAALASSAPGASPSSTPETLAAERALLDAARAALRSGDAPRALRDLDLHAQRFPAGVLVEERDAMTVQALVAAGRAEDARAAGVRFRSAHRGSLLEPTVDNALQSIP